MPGRAIIVSDVHLTWEGSLTYGSTSRLPVLLKIIEDYEDTELVFAGDVFDFLEAKDYNGWDSEKAGEHMEHILNANKVFVENLQTFIKKNGNKLVLLPGNHDPEVALGSVRKELAEAISIDVGDISGEELLSQEHLQQVDMVHGYCLKCSPKVWVLHGDRYDAHNFIDRAKLSLQPPHLKLPRGSQLVYKVLRNIRRSHPWFYYLDVPESIRILLLMLVDPVLFLESVGGQPRLAADLLLNMKQKRLADNQLAKTKRPGASAYQATDPGDSLDEILAASILEEIDNSIADARKQNRLLNRNKLLEKLERTLQETLENKIPVALPGPGSTLSSRRDIFALLTKYLQGTRRPERSNATVPFWQDRLSEPDIVGSRFSNLPKPVTTLIAGHTHGPRWIEDQGKRYINSGTWIPVGFLSGPVPAAFWSLHNNEAARAGASQEAWTMEVPATYVEVRSDEKDCMVMLKRLGADDKPILIRQGQA